MNITVFSKVLLVLIVHSCVTAIVVATPKAQHVTRIYEAGIDILMTCYGERPRTVAIAGDSDGSILRALRSKYLIPVVLIDSTRATYRKAEILAPHPLEVFIIASSSIRKFRSLMVSLTSTIWANRSANYIVLDTTPDANGQCSQRAIHMYYMNVRWGLIKTHFICFDRAMEIVIYNVNPFRPYAPKTWTFESTITASFKKPWDRERPFYLFSRTYRKGGRNCEDLNFLKTTDIGGYPLYFILIHADEELLYNDNEYDELIRKSTNLGTAMEYIARKDWAWFIDNVVIAFNATGLIIKNHTLNAVIVNVLPYCYDDPIILSRHRLQDYIFSQFQLHFFAVSQHTIHKSQLEKILTVIDRESRIGMCIVYLVTFLFFRFFLRQASVPAILDLVRLTCNTGLVKLPKNLAPTIYLACLFAFVVTLQGIYTGDLASLLTTTIAYPNVNTKQDIADLGYTAYAPMSIYNALAGDPVLAGCVRSFPRAYREDGCIDYVLSDPLATCVLESGEATFLASKHNLHISRDPILSLYTIYDMAWNNPIADRLEAIMLLWTENGLRRRDERVKRIMLQFVDDDDVKKNTVRRIMTLNDLTFVFIILFVGLAFSLICFMSELIIFRVQLKMAKRRNRARTRLAWGPTERNCFSPLNFRFNPRCLFSKRH